MRVGFFVLHGVLSDPYNDGGVVHPIGRWAEYGAEVIYGDTDSMFIRFPGASKETAFRLGKDIASYITTLFPEPIKLKFEKVRSTSLIA